MATENPAELARRVLELDKDATEGPWKYHEQEMLLTAPHQGICQFKDEPTFKQPWFADNHVNNADLIAEYRTAAPKLAQAVLEACERAAEQKRVNETLNEVLKINEAVFNDQQTKLDFANQQLEALQAHHESDHAKHKAEIERLNFAIHAIGFALGGKDLSANDVKDELCLRMNTNRALGYLRNTVEGLDVFYPRHYDNTPVYEVEELTAQVKRQNEEIERLRAVQDKGNQEV
jgi:hypothetical protein